MTTPDPVLEAIALDAAPEAAAEFVRLTTGYFAATGTGAGPVSTPHSPAELSRRFDEPMPRAGHALREVIARLERDVLADCNRLTHPMAMGHQVSAPLPAAVWTEMITAVVNNSGAVWEMSPTGTVIEARLLRWMCDLVGWTPASAPRAGGTFTSGGTEATLAALLSARSAAIPDVWTNGVGADPPVVVYGEHAHYAVTRAVGEMGLGLRRAVPVPTRDHRMDVEALARTLGRLTSERGARGVMAVVATAGSTPTGSFDDLESIGALCESHGIWLHVDGAHGASALFSTAHAHRLRGLARARSLAWDPHKMMLIPLSAGVVLMRDERDLEAAFAQRAPYLFHGGGGERTWDQGVRSFLCSRRVDALKVWVAIQRYGADGIGALYDRLCGMARALHEEIRASDDFEVMHEPECNILCFRWRGGGALEGDALDAANRDLRERYNRSGKGWITTTVLGGRRVLRVTVMNPATTVEHMRRLLAGLREVARGMA
jgi:L-2,4-diaminobutyrate decarboxylase